MQFLRKHASAGAARGHKYFLCSVRGWVRRGWWDGVGFGKFPAHEPTAAAAAHASFFSLICKDLLFEDSLP
jgi:hypothetical protein